MAAMKDFAELKGLRESLKEQEQTRAREKAEREERERVARQEAGLFRNALGDVKKLPESNRYVPNAPPGINVTIKPKRQLSQAEDDAAGGAIELDEPAGIGLGENGRGHGRLLGCRAAGSALSISV